MIIRNIFTVIAICIGISACVDSEQAMKSYAQDCEAYGFTPGTNAFAQCMQTEKANRAAAIQNAGKALQGMSYSEPQNPSGFSPGLGSTSALTVRASQICPMQYGSGFLKESSVSGMNRICYYR